MLNLNRIRHTLHQLAEPSGAEFKTQQYLLDILQQLSPTTIHIFKNSKNILVVYDTGEKGPTLLFRADFDAVLVDEKINIPYSSLTEGVSHKCGHDGHTTILLGLAEKIGLQPFAKGRILLFFQASEETGQGCQQLLESQILQKYCPDYVFALHNIPGEELGTVICKTESFTCSVVSCDIELHGHTSHASEPQKALNPYMTAKLITDKLLAFNCYDMYKEDFCLFTLVEFRVGEAAYGVTAGHGILRFTLRAKTENVLQQARKNLITVVNQEVEPIKELRSAIHWKEYFAASMNTVEAVQCIQAAAKCAHLPYKVIELPFAWGEDFGLLTQHIPGALFGLGSGCSQPSLHQPDFDFPDALISKGVDIFYEIACHFYLNR